MASPLLFQQGSCLKIRLPGPPSATSETSGRAKLTVLRYMFQQPDLLFIALHKAAISLLMSTGVQVILVDIAKNYFVIGVDGALSLGMMYCVNGIGSGIGPILARRWTGDRDKPLRVSISFGYVIASIGIAIMAPVSALGTVLFGGFVRSVGGGITWVFSTQLLLQRAPNEIRGRIFGTEFALFTLMGVPVRSSPARSWIGFNCRLFCGEWAHSRLFRQYCGGSGRYVPIG